MIRDLGIVAPGTTLYIPFHTFDSNDPSASVTLTGLATSDIEIYKDGSTTQRASDAGYALLDTDGIDFDGITGVHGLSINLADNTTAGFYAAGSQYWVVVSSITVDAATINFVLGTFRIGYPAALLNTSIATLASQTSFTLTAGPAEDDALNGMWAVIHDVASAVQSAVVEILDYTGSTRTVTLAAGATFTVAASDNIAIMGPSPLRPATTGRTAAVGTSGQIDANVTQFGGTNATTSAGRPEVNTTHAAGTAWGSGAITAGAIAADAITAAKIATGAIDADALATDAVAEIADGVWDEAVSGHLGAGSTGAALNAAGSAGDPWSTSLPGSYTGTQAGAMLADILTDTGTTLQGELDGIQADTEDIQSRLPAALVGGRIDANTGAISGDATAADNAEAFFDGTGYAGTGNVMPTVTTLTNAPSDSSGVTTLLARLTSTRAGYLDNLSAGAVATASALTSAAGDITSILGKFTGITSLAQWLGLIAGKQTGNATARTELRATGAGAGTFDETTDSIEAIRDRGDAAWTTATGFSTLDAAGVRTAVGLASANLDTQLTAIDDYLDTEIAAILVDTGTTLDDFVDDLESRLPAALATKLEAHAAGVLAVTLGSGSTTTSIVLSTVEGAAPSATNDFYNGAVFIITSGPLAGQRTDVTDYDGATGTLTVTALTGSPASGVTGLLV